MTVASTAVGCTCPWISFSHCRVHCRGLHVSLDIIQSLSRPLPWVARVPGYHSVTVASTAVGCTCPWISFIHCRVHCCGLHMSLDIIQSLSRPLPWVAHAPGYHSVTVASTAVGCTCPWISFSHCRVHCCGLHVSLDIIQSLSRPLLWVARVPGYHSVTVASTAVGCTCPWISFSHCRVHCCGLHVSLDIIQSLSRPLLWVAHVPGYHSVTVASTAVGCTCPKFLLSAALFI